MQLPPSKLLAQDEIAEEQNYGEIWKLMHCQVILPFWVPVIYREGLKDDSEEPQKHMKDYHPLVVLFLNFIRDNIFTKETKNESFLETFISGPGG